MFALPHHYRNIQAETGEFISINVTGSINQIWTLLRTDDKWCLSKEKGVKPIASITIPSDIIWKIFTRGIDK